MGQEPDVARVVAAMSMPGLRYRSFGNLPVRSEPRRDDIKAPSPEDVLRELRELRSGAVGANEVPAAGPPEAQRAEESPPLAPSLAVLPVNDPQIPASPPRPPAPRLPEAAGAGYAPPQAPALAEPATIISVPPPPVLPPVMAAPAPLPQTVAAPPPPSTAASGQTQREPTRITVAAGAWPPPAVAAPGMVAPGLPEPGGMAPATAEAPILPLFAQLLEAAPDHSAAKLAMIDWAALAVPPRPVPPLAETGLFADQRRPPNAPPLAPSMAQSMPAPAHAVLYSDLGVRQDAPPPAPAGSTLSRLKQVVQHPGQASLPQPVSLGDTAYGKNTQAHASALPAAAVTVPLGEVMRLIAMGGPPAATPFDTFRAALRTPSPY